MAEALEKRLIKPAEAGISGFSALSGLTAFWFVGVLAMRGVYWLFGWHYGIQSIGHFLGLNSPAKIFEFDRSFLLLAAAIVAFFFAWILQAFVDWAEKTPDQRRRERERRKEAFKAQQQREREQKAERKAARKPMSGWRRLWIVLSIVFGALAFWVAFDANYRIWADVPWHGDNDAFWSAAHANPQLHDCNWETAEAKYPIGEMYTVYCITKDPFTPALLWALMPALFMALVGLTIRWIYRGFRAPRVEPQFPGPNTDEEASRE